MTNPETPYEIAKRYMRNRQRPTFDESDALARAVIELQEERSKLIADGHSAGWTGAHEHIVAAIRKKDAKARMMGGYWADWIAEGCPDE